MRLKSVVILILLAAAVSAQTPAADDRFYQAIRHDDLPTLRALVRDEGVNARDAQGQTPLMLAAAFGSPEAVRFLIANGANVRAASNAGVTALHWAVTDLAKTRMLLDANADVNAVSQIGRTPLIVAASGNGMIEVVRLLLARDADVDAHDRLGVTPLIAAARVDDGVVANVLLARGANARANAEIGQAGTPLMAAALHGNADLVRTLLGRGSDLDAVSADHVTIVKNGPVRFGRVTALHLGVSSGNAEVVGLLLAAGAAVDVADVRGMTPLMFSMATDRPQPRSMRMLLERGADPMLRSRAGENAIDWARKFNNPAPLAELKLDPAAQTVSPTAVGDSGATAGAARGDTARDAVGRSLPLLRAASGRMMTEGGCVACHAQPMTAMAIDLARTRGWTSLSPDVESAQSAARLSASSPNLLQLVEAGGQPDAQLYVTTMMAAQRRPPTRATDALVHHLAAKQHREGAWRVVGATRAPIEDGDFSRTAMSIRALTVYATPARAREYKERVHRAAAWLLAQTPISTEDRVMQLLGLHWADADARRRQTGTRELLALQRSDGGWAQTSHLASDAYATGQVLYAVRELGLPAADTALQRGAAFLLRTQRDDGSWHVKSRAMKIQPYFESGFPHGHDQWISQGGNRLGRHGADGHGARALVRHHRSLLQPSLISEPSRASGNSAAT